MFLNYQREHVSPVLHHYIDVLAASKNLLPIDICCILKKELFVEVFHLPSFNHFMITWYVTAELSNGINQIMITKCRFEYTRFDDVTFNINNINTVCLKQNYEDKQHISMYEKGPAIF